MILSFAKILDSIHEPDIAKRTHNNTFIENRITYLQKQLFNLENKNQNNTGPTSSSQRISKCLKKIKTLSAKINPVDIFLSASLVALITLLILTLDNLAEEIY